MITEATPDPDQDQDPTHVSVLDHDLIHAVDRTEDHIHEVVHVIEVTGLGLAPGDIQNRGEIQNRFRKDHTIQAEKVEVEADRGKDLSLRRRISLGLLVINRSIVPNLYLQAD